jgi:hypothetical protein
MGHTLKRAFIAVIAAIGLALVWGASAEAEAATVKSTANLRAEPNTSSAILTTLPAGSTIEVLCWQTGEATYPNDAYGAMWLFTTGGGWVHSLLVTPVEVPQCGPAAAISGVVPPGGYLNCDQARASGPTPIYIGQPGYSPHLDRDHDGIGCEWDE